MRFGFSIEFDSADDFIRHWASKYKYDELERKYEENIGRRLTVESRRELFEWKNGSINSAGKGASIERNYPLTFDVGRIEERYLRPGAGGGAIWNIFYAHCLQPTVWPIFDQHVFRAMSYIRDGNFCEIPKKDREKLRAYRQDFRPFYLSFGSIPERRLDKALFMFGKFLKTAKQYAMNQPRTGTILSRIRRLAKRDDAHLYVGFEKADFERTKLVHGQRIEIDFDQRAMIIGTVKTTGSTPWLSPGGDTSNRAIDTVLRRAGFKHGDDVPSRFRILEA